MNRKDTIKYGPFRGFFWDEVFILLGAFGTGALLGILVFVWVQNAY